MTWTADQARHEQNCIAYLRLVFAHLSHLGEPARMQALQKAGHAIMTAPGGRA